MKKVFTFLFIAAFSSMFAQVNIVPNPGFENHTQCPDYPGQINFATGWNNVNLVYGNSSYGTPDYLHACGSASLGYNTVPPNTFVGTCMPHTGNGMAATIIYNTPYPDYREYMSIQLTEAMTPGLTYTVSFWITNGSVPKSPYIIKNVAAHLSVSPLTQNGWGLINLAPTCEITAYSGTTSWVQYTFAVSANAPYNYITLGAFRDDVTNAALSTYTGTSGPPSVYAAYFWDDIQVLSPTTALKEFVSDYGDLKVFPNPASNYISISCKGTIEEMKIYDHTGMLVKESKLVKDGDVYNVSTEDLSNGIYFVQFFNEKIIVSTQKVVKH